MILEINLKIMLNKTRDLHLYDPSMAEVVTELRANLLGV